MTKQVERGSVIIDGEDILDIINQRNNFRAVLEGAEYRNLDEVGAGKISVARDIGVLTAAMTKAALDNLSPNGQAAIEKVQIDFFAKLLEGDDEQ